jgi:CheY-like chemotaxis protein
MMSEAPLISIKVIVNKIFFGSENNLGRVFKTLPVFGYRVLTAAEGVNAVAIYKHHLRKIAVVLTDMMMPNIGGSATIHALMKINPTIKIIAASALNVEGSASKLSETGVNHFLSKPYTASTCYFAYRYIHTKPWTDLAQRLPRWF